MPRFRTGTKVKLNVYDGDRPIFQAHSEESAAELVRLLNLGVDAKRYRLALSCVVDNDSRGRGCSVYTRGSCRDDPGRSLLSGEGATSWCDSCIATDALTPTESPPSAPETASEPSDAPEGAQEATEPEEKLVDLMEALETSIREARAARKRKLAADKET
jgi:hypothetical protein